MRDWSFRAGVLIVGLALLAGCAQQVGDIDRTQPGILAKSDFQGEWYMRQTVTDVPATSAWLFVGLQVGMERIRWEITENLLIAYRSYPNIPGASDRVTLDADGRPLPTGVMEDRWDGENYYGEAIAAFRIVSHFDVQRSYNTSTGEQTNVIAENTSDRPWYEREFFRVDFGSVSLDSIDYIGQDIGIRAIQPLDETWSEDVRRRTEYNEDGVLEYFDFVNRYFVDWVQSCAPLFFGTGLGDCSSQSTLIRSSFLRVQDDNEYEPVYYSDNEMDRFGYFRTERITYDREFGSTVEGRILLANRHNIWNDTWFRGSDGEVLRDTNGKRIARPFAERTPKPIVYHLSEHFPQELMDEGGVELTARGWDRAFRRAVAAAQHGDDSRWEEMPHMFIICHNPVQEAPAWPADPALGSLCGEVGERPLIGDLRYNFKYWVNNPQLTGPLGYGPSAADPITGEIISGTAYMYGASVDTYAQASVNLVRFVNGDLTEEDIAAGDYVRDLIRERRDGRIDPRPKNLEANVVTMGGVFDRPLPETFDIPAPASGIEMLQGRALDRVVAFRETVQERGEVPFRSSPGFDQRRHQRILDSGMDELVMDDEWFAGLGIVDTDNIDDALYNQIRPARVLMSVRGERARERNLRSHRHCVMHASDFDDSLLGVAARFAGRTDYDKIYQEIRAMIYIAVQEHEIGHTIGLRHNFAGSMDTINYFDRYWELRLDGMAGPNGETLPLRLPSSLGDFYALVGLTDTQREEGMREYQYSTIMDYSSGFHTDTQGIGRYDEAAIIFGYTVGTEGRLEGDAASGFSPAGNRQKLGYVEVFNEVGSQSAELWRYAEQTRMVGFDKLVEMFHYLTKVHAMGNGDFALGAQRYADRSVRRLNDVMEDIRLDREGRKYEVPYLFCSDEYRSSRIYCRTWDRGADPFEQTLNVIQNYRSMHFFENYRRERLGWSPANTLNRYAGRYFLDLVDTYQRWLLALVYGTVQDSALETMWTLGSSAGLNLLAEVLTTPSYGSYNIVDLPVYDEDTGDQIGTRQEARLVSFAQQPGTRFQIPEGMGRNRNSRYSGDAGYYYYRFPFSGGHFWAYLAAVLSITSTSVAVQGVEDLTGFGDTTYVIPPYLVYEDEITRLFNGLMLRDYDAIAPLIVPRTGGEQLRMRPMVTLSVGSGANTQQINPETGEVVEQGLGIGKAASRNLAGIPVNLRHQNSEQIYAMLYGMVSFTSNFSMRFPDQVRIFRIGSGETIEAPPGFEIARVCDRFQVGGGFCYGAAWDPSSPEVPWAVSIIRRAQSIDARLSQLQPGTNAARTLENELGQLIDEMNLARSMYDIFGRNF